MNKILISLKRWLFERTMLVLSMIAAVAILGVVWHVDTLSTYLVEKMAVQDANRYVHALSEFRALYTSEVVDRVQGANIRVTHDYQAYPGAIPLPVTLSVMLGERLPKHHQIERVRLYSDYPFPWRKDGGPKDEFERDALQHLRQRPNEPFFRFEEQQGHRVIRYAIADVMHDSCVDCHNQSLEIAKNDWKIGDVRGVLEVTQSLDEVTGEMHQQLAGTFALLVGLLGVGLGGVAFVTGHLRKSSLDLERHVRQRTQQLQDREENIRLMVEGALDAVIAMDSRGCISEWNPRAEKMFGWSKQEVLGTLLSTTIIPLAQRKAHEQGLHRYLTTGEGAVLNQRIEVNAVHRSGHEFPIELAIQAIHGKGTVHFSAFVRDITDRIAIERELQVHQKTLQDLVEERTHALSVAKDAAEQANRAKSEFLTNMTHELRTPMHAILSFNAIAQEKLETASQEKIKHYLMRIGESGKRLLGLLNDLLDLSKFEAGKMPLNLREADLKGIVQDVLNECEVLVNQKALSVEFQGPEQGAFLICDHEKIGRVVLNLLSNAIKFTPSGKGITITIQLAPIPSGRRRTDRGTKPGVFLTVRDEGMGIPEEELEAVFDKFVQSSKTKTGAGGTGLGLAICQEIIHAHGGRIWAENYSGGGASFTFLLPSQPPEWTKMLKEGCDEQSSTHVAAR